MNDQWKSNGNCKLCRRQTHCTKPCKAHKRAETAQLYGMAGEIMALAAAKIMKNKIKGEEKDEI